MRISRAFLLLLMIISFSVVFSDAHGQSTSISELNYPSGITQDNLNPISVTVTVSYRDAGPNYTLVVGILDMDKSPQSYVDGLAASSPDACVNQPILSAWCVSRTVGSSGVEHLEFKIGGILGNQRSAGNWNLNITAALYDGNNFLVKASAISVPFAISVGPMTLAVSVPAKAIVWVDGVKQKLGSVQVPINPGTHNVTVPSIVQVDDATRLRFDHWADGPTDLNRTLTITHSMSLEAVYVTQYRLSVPDATASVAGQGWYDLGYTATFSVAENEQMSGLLGLLGGRLMFQGWYEDNKLLSDSPVDHIIMNKPHTLTVLWQADYTMPMIIAGVLIAVVFALAYVGIRSRGRSAAPEVEQIPQKAGRRSQRTRKTTRRPTRRNRPRIGRRSR